MVAEGRGGGVQRQHPKDRRQPPDAGPEPASQQQNRIQYQHDVDGAGMEMHHIPQGQGLPGGKQQSRQRSRQTEGVEHLGGDGVGPQGVP